MCDIGRVQKELKEIEKDKASGVTVSIRDNNLQMLVGTVYGPKDTPYDGGIFTVDIQLPESYPFVPPKMRFITKVRHIFTMRMTQLLLVCLTSVLSLPNSC
jgi:ubiquitin-conjugating enzyme (huntingtin interacting protein 2)